MEQSFNQILRLEKEVLTHQIKKANELWRGSEIQLTHTPEFHEQMEKESRDDLIFHPEAEYISTLLERVIGIMGDSYDRSVFIEILQENKLPEKDVCLYIVNQIKKYYWKYNSEKTPYFAYGSNMSREQMKERCPEAKFIQRDILEDYAFEINTRGVATIIPKKGSFVEGVLWELSPSCIESLDRYEGVANGTYKKDLLLFSNTINKEALVYIASNMEAGKPRDQYLEKIIESAKTEGLGEEYIDFLEKLLLAR